MGTTYGNNAARIIADTPEGKSESLDMARKTLKGLEPEDRPRFAPRLLMAAAFRHASLVKPPSWLKPFIDLETWNRMPETAREAAHRGHPAMRENIFSWLRSRKENGDGKEAEAKGEAEEAQKDNGSGQPGMAECEDEVSLQAGDDESPTFP